MQRLMASVFRLSLGLTRHKLLSFYPVKYLNLSQFLLTPTPRNNNFHCRHGSTKPKNTPKPKSPLLNEDDLEETFVKGSGPGGQCINKTNISVSLIHRPTGLRVQCHETRSREQNRNRARKILAEKVDILLNPGKSAPEQRWKKIAKRKYNLVKKRRRKERRLAEEANAKAEETQGQTNMLNDDIACSSHSSTEES